MEMRAAWISCDRVDRRRGPAFLFPLDLFSALLCLLILILILPPHRTLRSTSQPLHVISYSSLWSLVWYCIPFLALIPIHHLCHTTRACVCLPIVSIHRHPIPPLACFHPFLAYEQSLCTIIRAYRPARVGLDIARFIPGEVTKCNRVQYYPISASRIPFSCPCCIYNNALDDPCSRVIGYRSMKMVI